MTNVIVQPLSYEVKVDEQTNEITVSSLGPQGPRGVEGQQGPQGPKGDTGDVAALTYVHDQAIASDTWTIAHNKGFFLNITIVDSAGTQVEGSVLYSDSNTIVIQFAYPFAGKAYLS